MYIDFLTLLLINMAAGFALLAGFVWGYRADVLPAKHWVPAFTVIGAIAFIFGTVLTITWPLPGSFNIAFGEMSVLLGVTFLGAALAIGKEWSLLPLAGYAVFAGMAAMLIGIRILSLKMTQSPLLAGLGFLLSGSAGVLALPTLLWFSRNRLFRYAAVLVLAGTALIWALTGYLAYWDHLQSFQKWLPTLMRTPTGR
ncbi:MAG TPA: DUF981 domain-containing protein [Armatimonadota bacterium]|nr:DUF981 domain-containing protein [Armatimonadota bacterium]